jgi:diguanylate cyclase (GGDEF)-like protein
MRTRFRETDLCALRGVLAAIERERAEAQAHAKHLGGLARALAAIAGSRETGDVIVALLEAFQEALGFDRVIHFEPRGHVLIVRAGVVGNVQIMPDCCEPIAFPPVFGKGDSPSIVVGGPHDLSAPLPDARGTYIFASLTNEQRAIGFVYADGHRESDSKATRLEPVHMLMTVAAAALRGSHLYEQLRELALRDPLTGLLNRRALEDRLFDTVEDCRRRETECVLAILDVDDFKKINDVCGHAGGDAVLAKVATTLSLASREGDLVGRLAGDEFLIVFTDVANADARFLVRRLSSELRRSGLRCSLGAAIFPRDANDADSLVRAADLALYAVKAAGKNGFAFA